MCVQESSPLEGPAELVALARLLERRRRGAVRGRLDMPSVAVGRISIRPAGYSISRRGGV
jgi:DNA-binding response OmpR family regulator